MKKLSLVVLATALLAAATFVAGPAAAEDTITGRLVEAGCAAMGGAEPSAEHVACMVRCATNGDPIGIQTADGLYKITGDWASSNPDKLAELMAKQVRVTGETSEAGGEKLLTISSIELAE